MKLLNKIFSMMTNSDYLFIVASIYGVYRADFSDLSNIEIIYLAAFAVWYLLLGVRFYLLSRKKGETE